MNNQIIFNKYPQLKSYCAGDHIDDIKKKHNLTNVIKLASNENPLGPSPKIKKFFMNLDDSLTRYPEADHKILKIKLAHHHQIKTNQLTFANGSDELFRIIIQAFTINKDRILYPQYCFASYPLCAQLFNCHGIAIPTINFQASLNNILQRLTPKTKLIFIANPNNPTGGYVTHPELLKFLSKIPKNIIVILDEAYYEYARVYNDYPDTLKILRKYSNLIITRTFSKAYGLAGIRLGYAISSPSIAKILNKIRAPFNINSLALQCAQIAITDQKHLNKTIQHNTRQRLFLQQSLESLNLNLLPCSANFITFQCRKAQKIYHALLAKGIIIRPLANYAMPKFLRVSIGLKKENERFISVFSKINGKY